LGRDLGRDEKSMLRIGDIIFSNDILEKRFKCDLPVCHGSCCRYGDSGAPLTEDEAIILDEIWPEVKPYLRPEGINTIEKEGRSVTDFENDLVTPLIGNEECAYTILKDNIFMCGIEKAWNDGKISFQKPVSCHLFPARIKKFSGFTAINYQELTICRPALQCGSKEGLFVYEFLKSSLSRFLGEGIYSDLCKAAEDLRHSRGR
jgi:hypothetical protein